ncbi:MAG: energy transducer TonB [Ignavibacteriales bacterium]|nr:MAG: energy transducer TonB [Ignavibacteriales bacterium]
MKTSFFILLFSITIFSQTDSYYDEGPTCLLPVYDVMPYPIGGIDSIQSRLVYPILAVKNNIRGKVLVQAKIDSLGNVIDVNVVKGIGFGCDEEAVRLISETKFTPAILFDKPAPCLMVIPVFFNQVY